MLTALSFISSGMTTCGVNTSFFPKLNIINSLK
jgi:hypothetical protein